MKDNIFCTFLSSYMPTNDIYTNASSDASRIAQPGCFEAFDCLAVADLGRGRRVRGVWRGDCKGIPWCRCGLGPAPWRPPVSLQAPCARVGRGVGHASA